MRSFWLLHIREVRERSVGIRMPRGKFSEGWSKGWEAEQEGVDDVDGELRREKLKLVVLAERCWLQTKRM